METDEPVLQGFLLLPPSGKILKKSWQKKFCCLYKKSSTGIGRIEIFENETKTGQVKIITLEDVIKITPKPPNAFGILTKSLLLEQEFGVILEENLDEWFRAVKSVAFPEEINNITYIEEDNDLYCSSVEGVFHVKLHPSEASNRCKLLNKSYILVLTSTALQLRNDSDDKLLYTWPFHFIRRYGYKSGKFTFEAGRKCESGEGTFYLEHPNQQEIYRCLSSKMKSMKKLLKGESTSSLLDCGDAQLHAALSMEARSRSPLPPSPTTMTHIRSNQSSFQDSSHSFHQLHFSLSSPSLESQSIVKPMPKKPPRKSLTSVASTKSLTPVAKMDGDHVYQDVNVAENNVFEVRSKYDIVESRKEAWKTLGVEDPSHTEQTTSEQEDDYISWGTNTLTKSISDLKLSEKSLAPAVITEPNLTIDDQYYDHLNFFGSTSKLNTSSGYKQVIPPPLLPAPPPPHDNDYDEVEVMEAARSADDSHLGYAKVRKEGATGGPLVEVRDNKVPHQFHNDKLYALISKPKRV